MECRLTDLRHKEVISEIDGTRLGYVDDIIVDTKSSAVVAFVIFARIFAKIILFRGRKLSLSARTRSLFPAERLNPRKGRKNGYFSGKIEIFLLSKDSALSTRKRR